MLYLANLNLMFIHVPKNAGQSIRNALEQSAAPSFRPMALDLGVSEDEAKRLIDSGEGIIVEGLGRTKLEHLPLALVARHLPATWSALRAADAFALIRHPRDRFFSALLQRLREYRGAGATRADDPIVNEEARRVCEWLEGRGPFSDLEFIHFTRQVDYVAYRDERIVRKIFPVSRIDLAAEWIEAATGLSIDVSHDHARREPKAWASPIQPVARYIGRNLMPRSIKRALYPLWMNSGAFSNASGRYKSVRLDHDVEQFIATHYAQDVQLYEEAKHAANERPAHRVIVANG